ncbi:MAG: DUF4192 domain-containing protein [Propionicimonas sp.]|nr:DUF4192 domain-containing protein [Propionicimonas sp.]
MNPHDPRPRLRLRTVDDALGLIPHLLGFHPQDSLVVLVVDAGVVAVTARVDLADTSAPDGAEAVLARIWRRFPAADAWFVAYTTDRELGWSVLERCDAFLGGGACRRLTLVDRDTWYADRPGGPHGRHDPTSSPMAAEATVHGLVARPSRADLAALLDGPPAAELAGLGDLAERAGAELSGQRDTRWAGLMGQALREYRSRQRLTDEEAARFAILAAHPDARDVALLAMSRPDAAHHLELWRRVVNRTPPLHQGYALALLGMAAWITGEGALASICLERAEVLVPESYLVGILSHVTDAVVPPSVWDELRPGLLATARAPIRRAVLRPASPSGR